MSGNVRFHERGSAVIMAVGLLVMLAMLGTTFVIMTHLDRREANSLATAAPMKNVAFGVLEQILADRAIDLHFSTGGDPYSAATEVVQTIDHPSEEVDPMLASTRLFDSEMVIGGVKVWLWLHVSNPAGLPDVKWIGTDGKIWDSNSPGYNGGNGYVNLVDTDGFPGNDAILYDTGVRDRLGRSFHAAVRVVDASALAHVNIHYSNSDPSAAAAAGQVMPISSVSLLESIIGAGLRDGLHQIRSANTLITDYCRNYALSPLHPGAAGGVPAPIYAPFDISDMLALSWGGDSPSTGFGRLVTAMGAAPYAAVKGLMTTHSACRCLLVPGRDPKRLKTKIDLNRANVLELINGFYDLLGSIPDAGRRQLATQLALNAWDFQDADDTVSVLLVPNGGGAKAYGIERQPFVVEAGYKLELIDDPLPPDAYFAVELYNPYVQPIDMTGWKIKVGSAAPLDLTTTSIAANGRVTLVNRNDVAVTGTKEIIDTLTLVEEVRILRPAADGTLVVIGKVRPTDFQNDPSQVTLATVGEIARECIRRCDSRAEALYSLVIYKSFADVDITQSGQSNLGEANGVPAIDPALAKNNQAPLPAPVYVRNNIFVNVAELNRIFYLGPNTDQGLDEQLTFLGGCDPYDLTAANGRLAMLNNVPPPQSGIPALPMGLLAGDFFIVHSPGSDGWDNEGDSATDEADEDLLYGMININTAPRKVLRCLPGLAGITDQGSRDTIIDEIINYREKLGPYAGAARSAVLGMANLRDEMGFASPGEINIPLWRGGASLAPPDPWKLPQVNYHPANLEPFNYAVAGAGQQDDGLTFAAGEAVKDDLIKRHVYYGWMSNHITVRSDMYIAYIRVDLRSPNAATTDASLAVRRYVAVIDRSNCRNATDRPYVLMFAEIK